MDIAYAHSRFQKSYDSREKEQMQEEYEKMKQNRQSYLKPMSINDTKLSKEVEENWRSHKYVPMKVPQYIPPKFTKIGSN